jgi:superfamily I DNA and/or RNA helicase
LPIQVKNPVARKGGLETSLFRLLHEAHPEASVSLAHQYRMNADIMSLSNALVYDGGLHCGDPRVAVQTLDVPRLAELSAALDASAEVDGSWDGRGRHDWLQQILKPWCVAMHPTHRQPC